LLLALSNRSLTPLTGRRLIVFVADPSIRTLATERVRINGRGVGSTSCALSGEEEVGLGEPECWDWNAESTPIDRREDIEDDDRWVVEGGFR
jgi:hypothetical protein